MVSTSISLIKSQSMLLLLILILREQKDLISILPSPEIRTANHIIRTLETTYTILTLQSNIDPNENNLP